MSLVRAQDAFMASYLTSSGFYDKFKPIPYEFEILKDVNEKGKKNPWQPKKKRSVMISKSYSRLGYQRSSENVLYCGNQLEFGVLPDKSQKLLSANFCKDRLCPVCMWRKSQKIYHQVNEVYEIARSRYQNLTPIFLTLTVKNCDGEDLQATISNMMTAWNRMTQNRRFKNRIVGYFRALEVTYNYSDKKLEEINEFHKNIEFKYDKTEKRYHPHFHILMLVDEKSYFSVKKDLYMSQPEWQAYWKLSARLDYDPIVDIRKLKGDPKKAIGEVAKYSLKDTDFFDVASTDAEFDEIVDVLKTSLQHRRLHSFGGVMKEISKELNQDEIGEGDLVNVANKEDKFKVFEAVKIFRWSYKKTNYFLFKEFRGDLTHYFDYFHPPDKKHEKVPAFFNDFDHLPIFKSEKDRLAFKQRSIWREEIQKNK